MRRLPRRAVRIVVALTYAFGYGCGEGSNVSPIGATAVDQDSRPPTSSKAPHAVAESSTSFAFETFAIEGASEECRVVALRPGPRGAVAAVTSEPAGLFFSSDQGATWRAAPISLDAGFADVAFFGVDRSEGCVVGAAGSFATTKDGGATWTPGRKLPIDGSLRGGAWVEGVGVVVGDEGAIFTTRDGGATFERAASGVQEALFAAAAFGSRRTVVGAGGRALVSDDDGATWRRLETGTKAPFWTVAMSDASTILVAGRDGTVLLSKNGGASFEGVTSKTTATLFTSIADAAGRFVVAGADGATLVIDAKDASIRVGTPVSPRAWRTATSLENGVVLFGGPSGSIARLRL